MSNNTSLLQSLTKGILETSKSYCSHHTFEPVVDAIGNEIFLGASKCSKNVNPAR
jgi:hypothetical protein